MSQTKLLVIGCGGIGCELTKLLYTTNHTSVTFVDLDTIEISNLSRQFLFTSADVKKYKAEVIATKYKSILPSANVKYITQDITNYGLEFFKQFDFVFNCLDNNTTRSYVNARCVFAGVPFVDGGSTGFLGQALYFDGANECFDCVEKAVNVTVPMCTIRTNPTEFTHCLTWAKEYFFEEMLKRTGSKIDKKFINSLEILKPGSKKIRNKQVCKITTKMNKISRRKNVVFDKDDDEIMKLIYYVASIRAKSYKIDRSSLFESKKILGNIIPTLGFTNSAVASLMYQSYLTKHNYYLTRAHKRILRIEVATKNEACRFCSKNRFVLYSNESLKLHDALILIQKSVGFAKNIFTDSKIVFCSLMRGATDSFFGVKNNEIVFVNNGEEDCVLIYTVVNETISKAYIVAN